MYNIIIIVFLMFFSSLIKSQNTLSASYFEGHIPTSYMEFDVGCNGPSASLSITLPPGESYNVTNVNVTYEFTAEVSACRSNQVSRLFFANAGSLETPVPGTTIGTGVEFYNRNIMQGLGVFPGNTVLTWEMDAKRLDNPGDCNAVFQYINAWTITITFDDEQQVPKVGINETSPSSALEVNGKITLRNDNSLPIAGTMRWNDETQDFEGFDGNQWLSFTKKGDGWGVIRPVENTSYIDPGGGDTLFNGYSVDVDVDYAVSGAPLYNASNPSSGAVYTFKKVLGSWQEDSPIFAADGFTGDNFGHSVSVQNSVVVVGAPNKTISGNTNQGKVYVYNKVGNNWVETATLTAPDGAAGDLFGHKVKIFSDYIVVSALGKNIGGMINAGKIYTFKFSNFGTWDYNSSFEFPDIPEPANFGYSLDMFVDNIIVGAPTASVGSEVNQGRVYFYKRSGNSWFYNGSLTASDGAAHYLYGSSVGIHGTTAVIGSINKIVGGYSNVGGAYVANKMGSSWAETQVLQHSDPAYNDQFGSSVGIYGDKILISAQAKTYGSSLYSGKAYVFTKTNGIYNETTSLEASDRFEYDYFGFSASIHDGQIMIGAPFKYYGSFISGKIYFYQQP